MCHVPLSIRRMRVLGYYPVHFPQVAIVFICKLEADLELSQIDFFQRNGFRDCRDKIVPAVVNELAEFLFRLPKLGHEFSGAQGRPIKAFQIILNFFHVVAQRTEAIDQIPAKAIGGLRQFSGQAEFQLSLAAPQPLGAGNKLLQFPLQVTIDEKADRPKPAVILHGDFRDFLEGERHKGLLVLDVGKGIEKKRPPGSRKRPRSDALERDCDLLWTLCPFDLCGRHAHAVTFL